MRPADTPSQGLSRPRLLKQRKHGAAARARGAADSPPAFHPFWAADPGAYAASRGQDWGSSEGEVFVFGGGGKESSGGHGLPEAMGKLHIDESSVLPEEMRRKLDIGNGDADGEGDAARRVDAKANWSFVFSDGSRQAGSASAAGDATAPSASLPAGNPRKPEIPGAGAENAEGSDLRGDRGFVFGSRANDYPSVTGKSDGRLLDEGMKKLYINPPEIDLVFEKRKEVADGLKNSRTPFGVGDGASRGYADTGKSDFRGGSMASSLPDDMKKLNIESSGGNAGLKADSDRLFTLRSGKNIWSSLPSDPVRTLPDAIKKLSIGTASRDHPVRGGDAGMEGRTKTFVGGSGFKDNHVTRPAVGDLKENSMLQDYMEKLNLEDPATVVSTWKDSEDKRTGSLSNFSVFPAGSDQSGSGCKEGFDIPTGEMKQDAGHLLNDVIGRPDKYVDGNSSRSQFIFRKGNQEALVDNNMHAPFMQNDIAKTSAGASFSGVGPDSVTPHFVFRTSEGGREDSQMDSKYLLWTSRDSIFSGVGSATTTDIHMGASKDGKKYKRRNKSRQTTSINLKRDGAPLSRENSMPEMFESCSPGNYSPMDFSPYENLAPVQLSEAASLASEQCAPLDPQNSVGTGKEKSYFDAIEDLTFETQNMIISEFQMEDTEADVNAAKEQAETRAHSGSSSPGKQIPQQDSGNPFVASKPVGISDSKGSFITCPLNLSSIEKGKQTCDVRAGVDFPCSDFDANKVKQSSYTPSFSADFKLDSSTINSFPVSTKLEKPIQQEPNIEVPSVPETGKEKPHVIKKVPAVNQDNILVTCDSDSVQETCERWRLRGNKAYTGGNLSEAEEYYTRGVDCVPSKKGTLGCMRALMLCHSNRAATRMSLGRMREALTDCMIAISIDPGFLKVHLRAASCHLALGETEDACRFFRNCLQLGDEDSRRVSKEASDGLQKAQQVEDHIHRSGELLKKRSCDDASDALLLISDALSISPHSERLMEMKANALFMLRRYDEVIKFCEETVNSAEKNADILNLEKYSDQSKEVLSEDINFIYQKIWRWNLITKSYFNLGRLEDAVSLLQKHNIAGLSLEKCTNKLLKSLVSFSVTLQELVHQKAAGNNAYQANRHAEAVEHYTAAISCSTESRPFAAICFCNRAAAYQALGQVVDAIADCSLAIALDGSYAKAISRRAALHEMTRDHSQAINDLERLIVLLERRVKDGSVETKSSETTADANDLKRARLRLSIVEDELRKDIPLDLYMILGIEHSSSTADIKRAYRKAALRHHPDKACQLLTRSENCDDGLWKEVADEVHKDADRLFKMIGEAYAILSDRNKRLQYDSEEEMRSISKGLSSSTTPQRAGDFQRSFTERSNPSWQQRSMNRPPPSGSSNQKWFGSSGSGWYF